MFVKIVLVAMFAALPIMADDKTTEGTPEEVKNKTVSPPYFVVTAPEKVRPYSDYITSITLIGTSQPTSVTVALSDSKSVIEKSTVTIQPNSTESVKFQIKAIKPDEYNLTVSGDESFKFENSTAIQFTDKFQSVLIQTDRAMYKPGHKVQFRVLVLDAHLLPSKINTIDVLLKDGLKNRIKEWKNKEAVKGVFSSNIQLSAHPVLGDWTIVVKSQEKEYSKTFTVAEYVLPKFEVLVDVPNHATYHNSKVPVTVSAKYTYGQLVKGEATISVKPQYMFYTETSHENSKVIKVDKVGQTEIDIVKVLGLNDTSFYERTIIFDVSFKEDLTDKVLNGSASLTLHHSKCKLEFQRQSDFLVPGEEYKTLLKISTWDNVPYEGEKGVPVKVRYGSTWSSRENATWVEHEYSGNGMLPLSFQTNETTEMLNIEVEYCKATTFDTITRKHAEFTEEPSDVDLKVIGDKFKIGDSMEVDVITKQTPFFNYYVIGRNELLESKTVQVGENQKSTRIKVPITSTMAPEFHLLATYIDPKGEIIAVEKEVKVGNFMNNYLKLSASPNSTEPGKEVELSIESKPNSFVGLMGVDQSVLLLKKGNDISSDDIENELRSYNNVWYGGFHSRRYRHFIPWYPGRSTKNIFTRAGSVVMTNAYIHEEHFGIFDRTDGLIHEAQFDGSEMGSINTIDEVMKSVNVRKDFRETWIWDALHSGAQGKTSFKKIVPDTITSWVITGFSLSPEYGLGLTEHSTNVKVFRPFFISMNLPYSVTREEVVAIQVNVFNYMDNESKTDVTLDNPGWFTFVDNDTSTENRKKRESSPSRTKTITIGPNSAASATFVVIPKSLGYKEVKATAISPLAGDAVSHKLLIKPEGETQFRSKGLFIDLRDSKEFKADVELDIPSDIVPESELIEVSAVGDLLGSALNNLDKLIRQPYGCGEQNMLNFVPNIVILDYLKGTNQLTSSIEDKALKYMEMGYQRELTYKHKDNSYSAFGESDSSGSTWLTAFVAKSFIQAQQFISIETSTIIGSLQWLASIQHDNGSFSEVGHVSHKQMQGGASEGLALTSYVLTAFVEAKNLTSQFDGTITKAAEYVNSQLGKNTADVYSTAVASYALNLADHPAKDKAFNDLVSKAKQGDGGMWWEKEKEETDKSKLNPWDSWIPNAINVEVTAYGLLSYFYRQKGVETIPILKWLLSQQNGEGGFASTQDTVVALGAIAKISKGFGGKGKSLDLSFDYAPSGTMKFTVNEENALLLQKAELPSRKVRKVSVTGTGTGFAVAQISYRYNVNKKSAFPLFKLSPVVEKRSTKDNLFLTVCTSFTGGKESNMAVMEVTLPSGFTIDDDGIKALKSTDKVKRVETKNEDTLVVLYFDKVTQDDLCPMISATRTFKVAKQRPVPVTIYDYYDNSRRATEFYTPPQSDICDLCVDDDCKPCENQA